MKRRTKKVLSLLLAASMVFTMNTIAFGEELVAEDVAADDAAVETVVNDAANADLADAELEDAELAAIAYYEDGVAYDEKHDAVTKITFNSDGAKKNPVNSVAVIENATNPVSWCNAYAADFIETVINGTDKEDDYLNNAKKQHVSENEPNNPSHEIPNLLGAEIRENQAYKYGSIAVDTDVFLLYKYGIADGTGVASSAYVADYDGFSDKADDGTELPAIEATGVANLTNNEVNEVVRRIDQVPVATWDGRKIAWDKDNSYDATKSMKEDLKFQAALVKYENGTVTEINGVEVSGVKIDKKAIKQASVEQKTTKAKVTAKYYNTNDKKTADVAVYVDEHATLTDLPTFTVTLKATGKDAKSYSKAIKTALKDVKFAFGIMQQGIEVSDPTGGNYYNEYYGTNQKNHWSVGENDDDALAGHMRKTNSIVIPASANEVTNDEGTGIQDVIEKQLMEGGYADADKDSFPIDGLTISKFSAKKDKPKATITDNVMLYKKDNPNGNADVTLKIKKDYNFETYSLAGENVFALTFPEGGNYVYANSDPSTNTGALSAFGYAWAFRPSPVEKSKDFRRGIVAKDNIGFVYNAE